MQCQLGVVHLKLRNLRMHVALQDALQHLMNYVWPNVFETSPHLIMATFDAIDGSSSNFRFNFAARMPLPCM